ncbi:hypothetical protein UlMin_002715 [Ulmus minor]
MEEEMLSIVSNSEKNVVQEAPDSNCSVLSSPLRKHARHGSNGSVLSSPLRKRARHGSSVTPVKFKGVVPQQNGHWGAQIYANHQRVWLGTFKSEKGAAMAYDSAAIKLRIGDSHRNFPWTRATMEEPNFQSLYSTEALLSMIKDGSYIAKFEDFLRTRFQIRGKEVSSDLARIQNQGGLLYTQLFEKELTPSDVGKLNRLVIPKKYAVKYFPHIAETAEQNLVGGQEGEVQLVFHDRLMRSWKFRYCYWKSSQSYLFTRGWNRFVKDKHLKSNDTITFFLCKSREGAGEAVHFLMIDVNKAEENGGLLKATEQYVGLSSDLMLRLDDEMIQENNGKKLDAKGGQVVEATPKGFKLFGVLIE